MLLIYTNLLLLKLLNIEELLYLVNILFFISKILYTRMKFTFLNIHKCIMIVNYIPRIIKNNLKKKIKKILI